MQARYARIYARTAALVVVLALAWTAAADELSDFHASVEKAAVHNRVALGYLRTGNLDLAARELEFLAAAWRAVVDRFGARPPDAYSGNALYASTLTDVQTRIVAATILTDLGRGDAARDSLNAIRSGLSRMRAASGIALLADCVLAANAAMDAFFVYRDKPPDWSDAVRADVAAKAGAYGRELKRCDSMAGAPTRTDPQFRRLIDGAQASLALVPRAIETRDRELLHRVLIELRSFDNLIAFRFG
jgi:hypothetical protein